MARKLNFDINKRIRKLEIQQRNRTVIYNRFKRGFIIIFQKPWTLIFAFLLILLAVFVFHTISGLRLLKDSTFTGVCLTIFIFFMFFIMMGSLPVILGTPPKWKTIEAALVHIALVDRYGIGPALIGNEKIGKSHARRYTFVSKGIDKERWEKKQGEIEDILNVHLLEPIAYGRNRNYIVLIVASGVQGQEQNLLYDDEL